MHSVDLYFDFVSAYSWLALVDAGDFAAKHDVEFQLRPVVYGVLLNATGLIGPAEVATKRRYTFIDVHRAARRRGLRFQGPPTHPFRSLEALRLVIREAREPHALRLTIALFRACWEDGRDLTDIDTLITIASGVGIDTTDLLARTRAPEIKAALRANTENALEAGVFGVPTFAYRSELFWGHDRMPQLAEMLHDGREPIGIDEVRRVLHRPRGTDRKSVRQQKTE